MKSILIIKPSSLGDIVHALPAVAAIHDAYPTAQITWVINPEWAPFSAEIVTSITSTSSLAATSAGSGAPRTLLSWFRRTKTLRPDLAVDFQGLLRSAFIARSSAAKKIVGMSDAREGSRFFYDEVAKVNRKAHAVERYLKLAELVGAPEPLLLRCPLPTGDPLPRFDEYPPFVLLHPYARGHGKSLSNPIIEDFCQALKPTRVVVVGRSTRSFEPPENCVDLTNQTTLLQLVRLLRAAHFTISVDSGPMHIAAALSPRLLSIHTWTDPRRVGPYNDEAWVWKSGNVMQVSELREAGKLRTRPFKSANVVQIVQLIDEKAPRPQSALIE